MLDWLDPLPNLRVPGVPGVPAQFSAGYSGTPTTNEGVLRCSATASGTPENTAGTPVRDGKSLKNNEEHQEHQEHRKIDEGTLKRGLGQWHKGLASIDPYAPPAGISDSRWREIHADAVVLFNEWATRAARLGWRGLDLFGVNPDALADPVADPDAPHGLAWRLRGRRIQRMFDGGASYALMMGKPGNFYRGETAGRVLLWTLIKRKDDSHA